MKNNAQRRTSARKGRAKKGAIGKGSAQFLKLAFYHLNGGSGFMRLSHKVLCEA